VRGRTLAIRADSFTERLLASKDRAGSFLKDTGNEVALVGCDTVRSLSVALRT